jgi:hypothetical protein
MLCTLHYTPCGNPCKQNAAAKRGRMFQSGSAPMRRPKKQQKTLKFKVLCNSNSQMVGLQGLEPRTDRL